MADSDKLFNSDLGIDEFLAGYWQQKPLLLRRAITDFDNPLSPDTLAELACDEDSNARLVLESGGERPWSVEYGPFEPGRFAELPDTGWSLLVSDVERLLPGVLDLQQRFRFIPDWRFDDVMFSHAPEGGSVGPHLDAYDVFLLQVRGRRNWKISLHYGRDFLGGTDLEILRGFDAEHDWILEPGDLLYLPPGVAHHGIAVGDDCMTCSIGFRTPAAGQLAAEFIDFRAEQAPPLHYEDAAMPRQPHPAEISAASLRKIRSMVESVTAFSDAELARWFGAFISENRAVGQARVERNVPSGRLNHHPDCRLLFMRDGATAILFVDGESFDTSLAFAERLCAARSVEADALRQVTTDADREVLDALLASGCLLGDAG